MELSALLSRLLEERAPLFGGRQVEAASEAVSIRGDAALLGRAIGNILDNAAQHTAPGGTIWVRLGREGRGFVLEVENQGEPIPEEDVERVFGLFYRTDKARTRGGSGTGVGLAVTARICALHHLRCFARNTERGVCFTITTAERPL